MTEEREAAAEQDEICGKVVARVEYDYEEELRLHFTDGSMLYVAGVWHNDSTAGTDAALLGADDPKSWKESRKFYELLGERSWAP